MKTPNKIKEEKIKFKQGDIVLIDWLDAFGRGTWENWDTIRKGFKEYIVCELVGFYVAEDKNFYCLTMGITTDPGSMPFLKVEFIPKGAVIKIVKLKN